MLEERDCRHLYRSSQRIRGGSVDEDQESIKNVVGSNDIQWNIREYDGTQWNIMIVIGDI